MVRSDNDAGWIYHLGPLNALRRSAKNCRDRLEKEKTADPHPTLPETVFTAAESFAAVGGAPPRLHHRQVRHERYALGFEADLELDLFLDPA
jgi:hypothetical protein